MISAQAHQRAGIEGHKWRISGLRENTEVREESDPSKRFRHVGMPSLQVLVCFRPHLL